MSKATRKIALIGFWGPFFSRSARLSLFLAAAGLLIPTTSSAQSPVNVTATVKDSAGIPYSNATVSILLIPTGTAPTVGGAQISGTNNGQLDVNGKLNVSLYKNTDIVPASSQWQFTICETPGVAPPLGTGGQCFTSSQTVSAAVDFSTQFQAAAKALTTVTVGGSGSVTHTAGNLTAGNVVIGNGAADVKVDSACLTNGTGALSGCTSLSAGSGASAAGATATGGFACVEAASTGWTPTVGQDYQRCDSATHTYVCSLNGAAEAPCSSSTPNPATTNGFVFYDGSKLSTNTSLLYTSSVAGFGSGTGPALGLRSGVNLYSPNTVEMDLGITSAAGMQLIQGNLFGTSDVISRLYVNAGTGWGVFEQSDQGGSLGMILSTTRSTSPISIRPNRSETFRFPSVGGHVALESVAPTNIAASTAIYEDSTRHEEFAATAGASTFGMKVRVQPGKIHQTAQTAAITTATLCAAAAGACNVAGNYTVEWAFTQVGTACGTPGAGGVTFLLTWTDQNGVAHSAIQMPMDDAASLVATTGTFHFTTSNATAWGSGNMNISSNGSILQYATGYTACGVGTGSYQLDAWVTAKE